MWTRASELSLTSSSVYLPLIARDLGVEISRLGAHVPAKNPSQPPAPAGILDRIMMDSVDHPRAHLPFLIRGPIF